MAETTTQESVESSTVETVAKKRRLSRRKPVPSQEETVKTVKAEASTLVRVLDSDIFPYFKPGCSRCSDGKLSITLPGEKKSTTKPCECSMRRFVKKHQGHILVNKGGELFYSGMPEDEPAVEPAAESPAPVTPGPSNHTKDRIRRMYQQISVCEVELKHHADQYDRCREPVGHDREMAQKALATKNVAAEVLKVEIWAAQIEIDRLTAVLEIARQDKARLEAKLVEDQKTVDNAFRNSAPERTAMKQVDDLLDSMERKYHGKCTPARQRIDSLRKRIDHLAAIHALRSEILAVLQAEALALAPVAAGSTTEG
jgi:hypothetical protein